MNLLSDLLAFTARQIGLLKTNLSGVTTRMGTAESNITDVTTRVDNIVATNSNSAETLYNNVNGFMDGTITLSKSIDNFDFLDIFFADGGTGNLRGGHSERIPAVAGTYTLRTWDATPASADFEAEIDYSEQSVTISGTTFTAARNTAIGFSIASQSSSVVDYGSYLYQIVKIVGIKMGNASSEELTDLRVGADNTQYSSAGEAVRTQFNNISQISRNLWKFEPSFTFTRYKYLKPGGVVLPAGTYKVSASITSSGSGTMARIAFENNADTQISYASLIIDGTRHESQLVTLSEDCYAIWLFSQNGSSPSQGIEATWNNIQIEASATGMDATDYVPHISARDTVSENRINQLESTIENKIYGNGHLLSKSVGIETLDIVELGSNLFNFYDTKNVVGYLGSYGKVVSHTSYKTSWYIEVEPSTTYYVGGTYRNSSYKNASFIAEFDEDLNKTAFHTDVVESFTTQATTKYVRFTYGSGLTHQKIYFGKTAWDGGICPAYSAKIPKEYLESTGGGGSTEELMPRFFSASGDLGAGDYLYNTAHANSIRHNERIVFNADITSFSQLEIGFAWFSTNYKYNKFVIDSTNLTVYNYAGNTSVNAHGLTFTNNIQVIIESNFMRTCKVTIISDGQMYSKDGLALDRRRVCFPYVQSVGSVLPNAKITWTCTDFSKDVWIFGDSYVAGYTDKWTKYAYTYGYTANCLFDAFGGEDSSDSVQSLQNLLDIAQPKILVWCLGMNDGSDDENAPASRWSSGQSTIRQICEEKGIELVLATIPSVPTINHEAKNANVRSSGYRYIDFAKAVGASSNGVWYSDMLSNDGVHPSDTGAKALFGRVLLDFPEIMIEK